MNIAIYTNILTPYRRYFYDMLYSECLKCGDKFYVIVMADTEPDRNWVYEDLKAEYTVLLKHYTIVRGSLYFHFNRNLKNVLEKLNLDILICAGGYLSPGLWKIDRLKKKMKFQSYFWSESHLHEERDYGKIKLGIREYIRKRIYQKFDGFWYAGKMSRDFIERYAKSDTKMFLVPNLVEEKMYYKTAMISDNERKKTRGKFQLLENKTVFFCPARLASCKGIDKFLPILEKCYNRDKVTVLLAGDGELEDIIREQIRKSGLDVRMLGFQNQKAIVELYSITDIFLLPSISDPNPLSCIEALWSGLPLFISNQCGNYPEVVQSEVNGYIFDYNNIDEAVYHLEKIIDSSKEWRDKARKVSLAIAENLFCTKTVIGNLIKNLHEQLINKNI